MSHESGFFHRHRSGSTSSTGSNSNSNSRSRAGSFSAGTFASMQEDQLPQTETVYQPYVHPVDAAQETAPGSNEEVMGQDSKALIVSLIKQVKIGMDLSRVVLPTFILEPKSMLEKVSDFLTHTELLVATTRMQDSLERMVGMVRWYLSGFYLKPKGVKKPYNPVLGEFFRCMWELPSDSKTFFVGEQVSHHPPISAFYASNRKEGIVAGGSILFRSKFYGTSVGSILEGSISIHHLRFGEDYELTFPSAYGKGFLFGTLVMELGGIVTITCKQSGWRAELDFRLKPMFGGDYNTILGKIKDINTGNVVYQLTGRWDQRIDMTDASGRNPTTLWEVTPDLARQRLEKLKPCPMHPIESDKLWEKVTQAIVNNDQQVATDEKARIEQSQRDAVKCREEQNATYQPKFFVRDEQGNWVYKWFNKTPWDPSVEDEEFEAGGIIG
eukprot:TRINITY_DN2520_c0_g1_i2.p1 TRINITY_DN2520_c0_g1~~TRINITY_DN2520_c0_g1_i2.p1  ORF type:complete len:441 (+),score=178.42 TRINITY_DN2520_c0_g1_i2:211-1533(+)